MKLIKLTSDHYIIVDDSEIKAGDYVLTVEGDIIVWIDKGNETIYDKKITHSTQPESLGMGWMQSVLPLLLSEVKELIGNVDVEEKANQYLKNNYPEYINPKEKMAVIEDYKTIYTQALEDNKDKKYTEEDLLDAFTWGFMEGTERGEVIDSVNKFSQSLQPKTEWNVEFVDGKLKLM